jgi:hypothetical protein
MVGQPVGDVGGGWEKLSVSYCDELAEVLSPVDAVSISAPQFVQKRIPSALSRPHFPHLIIETPSPVQSVIDARLKAQGRNF